MADINKINANGTDYNIEDSTAREKLNNINLNDYVTIKTIEIEISTMEAETSIKMQKVITSDYFFTICGYFVDMDGIVITGLYFYNDDGMITLTVQAYNTTENPSSATVTVYYMEVKE